MRLHHLVRVQTVSLVLASLLAVVLPGPARAQDKPDPAVAATLALPITPGAVALLVEHPNDPAVQQRVREALKDSRPEVRTVAARVVYGVGLRMLLSDLRAVLKAEQNPVAAAEEARAMMTFAPGLAPECVAAAGRLGKRVATEVVDTYARLNSVDLIAQLSALEAAQASPYSVRTALQTLMDNDGTLRDRLLRERPTDAIAIEAALASFRRAKAQPADDLLVSFLQTEQEDIRLIAEWQLARGIADQTLTLTPPVAAVVDARVKETASAVTWEGLALDLIARASNRSRHERHWSGLPPIEPNKRPWNHAEDRVLFAPLLSNEESRELAAALHINPETLIRSVTLEEIQARKLAEKHDFVVRTVPRLAEGLEGDLLRLTGCETQKDRQAIANLGFRPDGRPRQFTIMKDDSVPESCRRAAQVLFSLTVPKFAMPIQETYTEVLVLPIEHDQIACADAPMPQNDESQRPGGKLKAPVRVKMVNPVYPQSAQKERRDGVVLIEANISRTGCVVDASVINSPDPRLSAAALYAVIQWRYSPVLLDDKPVPVIMTVTVNFMLP